MIQVPVTLPANIRLQTLAHYENPLVMDKKCFIIFTPGVNVINSVTDATGLV